MITKQKKNIYMEKSCFALMFACSYNWIAKEKDAS